MDMDGALISHLRPLAIVQSLCRVTWRPLSSSCPSDIRGASVFNVCRSGQQITEVLTAIAFLQSHHQVILLLAVPHMALNNGQNLVQEYHKMRRMNVCIQGILHPLDNFTKC